MAKTGFELQHEYEIELLKHLRKEAFEVKHCFTQYSFQALALVTAILGIALKFYEKDDLVGLVGIPLTILLVTIASIGTHKYSTANRILGYELHLQRTSRYAAIGAPGWHSEMRKLGWEEALRAWRIFQATVFEYIYVSGNLTKAKPNPTWRLRVRRQMFRLIYFWQVESLNAELINSKGVKVIIPPERWFETRTHLEKGMSYYPGGYLQTILNLIYLTASICMGLSIHTAYRLIHSGEALGGVITLAVVLLFSYWSFVRFLHCYRRRKVLEEGLLSINSCAVLWQAVACAHYLTLQKLSSQDQQGFLSYKDYSKTLGAFAVDFSDNIFDIYGWYAKNTPAFSASRLDEVPSGDA